MNRKNQVLATSLSLLLSVGMSGGTILPAYATENAENTEVQTDVATNGNAEQSENGAQSQKEATPEAKEKTSNQAAAQSSSLPDSSKSVKENSADEEEGEGGSDDPYVTGIEISEKNFPDKGFREYVKEDFDTNHDGWIRDDELDNANAINLEYPERYDEDEDNEDENSNAGDSKGDTEYIELLASIKNFNGAELLPNLQTIHINLNVARKGILDDMDFSKLKQLGYVEITCHTEGSYDGGEHDKTLKKIDLTNCKELQSIDVSRCDALQSIELGANTNLAYVIVKDGNLTQIDFTQCPALTNLTLGGKGITSIDLSKNTKLEDLDVTESGLTALNLSQNTNLLRFTNEDYIDTDTKKHVQAAPIESLNFSNLPNLESVRADGTALKRIHFSNNENLTEIIASGTSVKSLDVSGCPNLGSLSVDDSGLTTLDVSKNSKLESLDISNTKLTAVDVSQNPELGLFDASNTGIKTLDISKNKKLYDLNLSNTSIDNMKNADFSDYTNLSYLTLDNAGIESIKFGKMDELYGLSMKGNHILETELEGQKLEESEWGDEDFNADNQTPTITLEPDQIKNNTVALSDLFSDVGRVTIEKGEGYTYDADAKAITFQDKKNRKFKYTWDTKLFDDGSALLKGTATILVPNEPEEKPDPKPEVKYDTLTKIKLGTTRYTYDGKVKKPSVTAYIGSTRADASKYKVTYPTGMKNIGSYTVKVTGNQSKFCKGTLTATYRIDPKKVKTPSAKAGKKKVTVKWTKVSGGVKYQMAIAKKGGKYKTYAVSGNSKTAKKLTSKKKYTVKVRAYKKVGKKTYYGDWSKTKTVKVK